MEHLSKTIGMICILVMAIGLLNDLGKFPVSEKTIRFIAALYIVVAFFKAFSGTKIEISSEYIKAETVYTDNENILKSEVLKQSTEKLEQLVKKRLDEKNISYNDVSVHILEQNGDVKIDKIFIDCDNRYETEVRLCINDLISEETEIHMGE